MFVDLQYAMDAYVHYYLFATLWLAPTTIGLTALSQDLFFTSKVHLKKYILIYIIRILILCCIV